MKIEIWSDIACPFCYIGKRKLEKAIQRLPDSEGIVLEWKSFQLNPTLQTDPNQNTLTYLAETKGWTMEQTVQMTAQVTAMGKEEGLNFNFEKTAVANTKRSHRLLHLAKEHNCQNELKKKYIGIINFSYKLKIPFTTFYCLRTGKEKKIKTIEDLIPYNLEIKNEILLF